MMIFHNDFLYIIKLKFMHDIKLLNYFWAMIYTFVQKQMPKLPMFTAEGYIFKMFFAVNWSRYLINLIYK